MNAKVCARESERFYRTSVFQCQTATDLRKHAGVVCRDRSAVRKLSVRDASAHARISPGKARLSGQIRL